MRKRTIAGLVTLLASLLVASGLSQEVSSSPAPEADANGAGTLLIAHGSEQSSVRLTPARLGPRNGIAVIFEGTQDLHYYAKSETAPAPGFELKVEAESNAFEFGRAVFPKWRVFTDAIGTKVEVYAGNFTIFIPLIGTKIPGIERGSVAVKIRGIACTSMVCLPPFEKALDTTIDLAAAESWTPISLETAEPPHPGQSPSSPPRQPQHTRQALMPYSTSVYYLLAIVAGISINIMPCVLPVIPLILARLIQQSKQSPGRIVGGAAFCAGVILFFVTFAVLSAIINLSTGAILDLNSLFRYPPAVIILFVAIVLFGLVMLDVVSLSLPSAVTSKQAFSSGLVGTAGMGFFASILSTPCSGALLGFVLVWAQTQPLLVSSTAIVLMGVGMALPYAVITSIPSLLERIPKPGTWMEIFKKSTGFLLFFIAAKLTLAALPKDRLLNVLTYGVIFSFCAWMWGKWVGMGTPVLKRRIVRAIAAVCAVAAGLWLLPAQESTGPSIDWQTYDRHLVQQAVSQNQPVLLKFTADWCTNCKIVDKKVYHDPQVRRLIEEKNVLAVRADTTVIDYIATIDLKQTYGEAGNVPVTIVLLPNGDKVKLRGIFDKKQLVEILEKLPEKQK